MNRKLLLATLASTLAIAACKPAAESVPAAPAPAAPVAVESAPSTKAEDVPFDIKGFAGTFSGTLPCTDCPGIDTTITLNADGTYVAKETRQGQSEATDGDGTWTAEENGLRLRLDPNSKSDQDRLFAVKSKDEIETLDAEGKAVDTTAAHSLKREAK